MKTLVDAHTDLCAIDHLAKGVVLVKPSETMRLRCLVKAMLQLRCQAGQEQEPDDGGDAGRLAPMFAAVAAAVAAAEEEAAGVTPAVPLVYDATVAVVPAVHDEGVVTDGLVPAPRPVAPDGLTAPG